MTDAENDAQLTVRVLADLERLTGAVCRRCEAVPCGHELVIAIAMGFKDEPSCVRCVCAALGREPGAFREHVLRHILHRDCFRAGWEAASEREGCAGAERPACLWPDGAPSDAPARLPAADAGAAAPADAPADAEWDAGDMSCGDLVLELRGRLRALEPGRVILVTATDLAAPEDLPAWCRLTGHRMLRCEHPRYWIQRKEG